jgi:hypothetical protein
MSGQNIYLLTALPPLGELGSPPPLTLGAFLEHVAVAARPHAQAEALFLGDDLRQREALLAGEVEQADPAVLTAAQVRNEEPLPAFVAAGREGEEALAPRLEVDAVWEAYYRRVRSLTAPGEFLAHWARFEVGLRNALAAARAKSLGLEADRYLVAPELGLPEDEYDAVAAEWSAASDPLAGSKALDATRWQWLTDHDRWFSFADDELAAYAAKLMLLHRWQRISEASSAPAPESRT